MLKFAYEDKSHSSHVRVPSYGGVTETFPPRTVTEAMDGREDSRFAFHCKYMTNLVQLSVFIGDTFFAYMYHCKRCVWYLSLTIWFPVEQMGRKFTHIYHLYDEWNCVNDSCVYPENCSGGLGGLGELKLPEVGVAQGIFYYHLMKI